jgi:hypothetical protein
MKLYKFTVVLDRDPSDEETDRLYGIFSDGTIATLIGVPQVAFHREAESLETAIRSAIADSQAGGMTAVKVELEPADLAASA